MEITVQKEVFEYWESSGHIIVRSKSYSGIITEIPKDSVTSKEGWIITLLLADYIKNMVVAKPKP